MLAGLLPDYVYHFVTQTCSVSYAQIQTLFETELHML